MSYDVAVHLGSRVILTTLCQVPLTTGIAYNAIDLAVSYAALNCYTRNYFFFGVSMMLGCATATALTPGMDGATAAMISGISAGILLAVNQALPARNAEVRN